MVFRIRGGPFDGRMALAWRNVDSLTGPPRERGKFVVKNPSDERSKYAQEWIQVVRPRNYRRDRMSPQRLKGMTLEGEVEQCGDELRVVHFWNPLYRNDEVMSERRLVSATKMPLKNEKDHASALKDKDNSGSIQPEKWQNNRLTERTKGHGSQTPIIDTEWMQEFVEECQREHPRNPNLISFPDWEFDH